jgi:hypothetical protein
MRTQGWRCPRGKTSAERQRTAAPTYVTLADNGFQSLQRVGHTAGSKILTMRPVAYPRTCCEPVSGIRSPVTQYKINHIKHFSMAW